MRKGLRVATVTFILLPSRSPGQTVHSANRQMARLSSIPYIIFKPSIAINWFISVIFRQIDIAKQTVKPSNRNVLIVKPSFIDFHMID